MLFLHKPTTIQRFVQNDRIGRSARFEGVQQGRGSTAGGRPAVDHGDGVRRRRGGGVIVVVGRRHVERFFEEYNNYQAESVSKNY